MNPTFTGIGARSTPETLKPLIKAIVEKLNDFGYTLRSGGADGADTYFETYALKKEIYLPWKGFNRNPSPLFEPSPEAYEIAAKFHPAWHNLRDSVKALMARNSHQILGLGMKTPTEFVVCWTADGKASGGTGMALRVAEAYNIPIFNLKNETDIKALTERLKEIKNVLAQKISPTNSGLS